MRASTPTAFLLATLVACAAGCTLNPQPLPPEQPGDAAPSNGAFGDGGQRDHGDASVFGADASSGADAGPVPPGPEDGGSTGVDGGASDASVPPDAEADAGSDAAPADAALDSGGD